MTGERKRFYKRPIFYIPAIVVAVPALWLAWWLGSPLFLNKTVIEAFPTVSDEIAAYFAANDYVRIERYRGRDPNWWFKPRGAPGPD